MPAHTPAAVNHFAATNFIVLPPATIISTAANLRSGCRKNYGLAWVTAHGFL